MTLVASVATWLAALLALFAAVIGFWCWRSNTFRFKHTTALLSLGAAISGFVALWADWRISVAEEQWRATPPVLDVAFELISRNSGKVRIVSETDVPFSCKWVVVTRGNIIVGTDWMEAVEIYPRIKAGPYSAKEEIEPEKIIDSYLEVRLRCESLFSAELGYPSTLSVRKFRSYRVADSKLVELESGDIPRM